MERLSEAIMREGGETPGSNYEGGNSVLLLLGIKSQLNMEINHHQTTRQVNFLPRSSTWRLVYTGHVNNPWHFASGASMFLHLSSPTSSKKSGNFHVWSIPLQHGSIYTRSYHKSACGLRVTWDLGLARWGVELARLLTPATGVSMAWSEVELARLLPLASSCPRDPIGQWLLVALPRYLIFCFHCLQFFLISHRSINHLIFPQSILAWMVSSLIETITAFTRVSA
jgi:hypothetical protein